jgi:hypothetical protein
MVQCLSIKKTPNQFIRPIPLGEMVRKNSNQVCYAVFGHLGAIWTSPSEPQKIQKRPQVDGMYGPMSKLLNKPLTKSLGPFF